FVYALKYMRDHLVKKGFKRPVEKEEIKVINVGELETLFPGEKEINLKEKGYDKLLGKGSVNSSIKVIVSHASQKAIDKIKEKGGEVIIE
ncbi:MAG TPA: 50S ribosomal protein L15, partial [Thermoplasmatales archaeon]|nr:50S ribosomal protein L15 [Thermoplasmatales archaeon]